MSNTAYPAVPKLLYKVDPTVIGRVGPRVAVLILSIVTGEFVAAGRAWAEVGPWCQKALMKKAYNDRQIGSAERYQPRDDPANPDRCEGQVVEQQGLRAELARLERACGSASSTTPAQLTLSWSPAPSASSALLRIRSFNGKKKYVLDSLRPMSTSRFSWSSSLMMGLGLRRADLRFVVTGDPPPAAGSSLYLPTTWSDQSCAPNSGYVASILVDHVTTRLDIEVWTTGSNPTVTKPTPWNGAVDAKAILPLVLPADAFGATGEYLVKVFEKQAAAGSEARPLLTFSLFHTRPTPLPDR